MSLTIEEASRSADQTRAGEFTTERCVIAPAAAATTGGEAWHPAFLQVPAPLFTVDRDGFIGHANRAFEHLASAHGAVEQPYAGSRRNWNDLFDPQALPLIAELDPGDRVSIQVGCSASRQAPGAAEGAQARWYDMSLLVFPQSILVSVNEVTQWRSTVERLRDLADHDPLTKLWNRRGLDCILAMAYETLERGGVAAIAYVDLDHFKPINDRHGHAAGDEVLATVARRMEAAVGNDAVARIGGDEFVLIFDGMPLADVRRVCDDVLDAIRVEPYDTAMGQMRLDASIGLVPLKTGVNARAAIAAADAACRQAKTEGKSRVVSFDADGRRIEPAEHEQAALPASSVLPSPPPPPRR